jgi:hypothetical protein
MVKLSLPHGIGKNSMVKYLQENSDNPLQKRDCRDSLAMTRSSQDMTPKQNVQG